MALSKVKNDKLSSKALQGYPNDACIDYDRGVLDASKNGQYRENTADAAGLIIGTACTRLKTSFEEKLNAIAKKFDFSEVTLGQLKKCGRMYDKAVHYAVEEEARLNAPVQPVVERVRDILRGTIHMDLGHLEHLCLNKGTIVVDAVAETFPGKLLQVKNRFIQAQAPNIAQAPGKSYDELKKLSHTHWFGRDFYYRDLQFLVLLDESNIKDYKNLAVGSKGDDRVVMDHIIAEIQLAINPIYTLKSGGGHSIYKSLRRVFEYEEAETWGFGHQGGKTQHYNQRLTDEDKNNFGDNITHMLETYKKATKNEKYSDSILNVIDNSKWYKSITT